jgi:hypothetical protein
MAINKVQTQRGRSAGNWAVSEAEGRARSVVTRRIACGGLRACGANPPYGSLVVLYFSLRFIA